MCIRDSPRPLLAQPTVTLSHRCRLSEDVAEEVKHRPALVQATLAVLSYPHAMRPFQAVRSADIDQVRAWLSMLERPSDVDQQMELYTYTAFSLACALGHRKAASTGTSACTA